MNIRYLLNCEVKGTDRLSVMFGSLQLLNKLPFTREAHNSRTIGVEDSDKDNSLSYRVFDMELPKEGQTGTDRISVTRHFVMFEGQLAETEYRERNFDERGSSTVLKEETYNPPRPL